MVARPALYRKRTDLVGRFRRSMFLPPIDLRRSRRSTRIVGWNGENLTLRRRKVGGAVRVQRLRVGGSVERFTQQLDLPVFGHEQPGEKQMDETPGARSPG